MSVKNDYERCQAELNRVREARVKACSEVGPIQKELNELRKTQEEFSKRSSPLAKKLLKITVSKILDVEKKLEHANQAAFNVELNCKELERSLAELKYDPSKYIEEQSTLMTRNLISWVTEHEMALGSLLDTKFVIQLEERTVEDFSKYGAHAPTGNIEIYSLLDSNKERVANSIDFFFEETRCTIWSSSHVSYSDWFTSYLKAFFEALKSKITTAFEEHPNFSVHFTDESDFTLELR